MTFHITTKNLYNYVISDDKKLWKILWESKMKYKAVQ